MLEVDSEQTRFVGIAQPPVMVGSSRSDSDRTPLPPIRAAEWQGKKPTRTKALPPTMRKARWQHFKHAKLAAFLAEASVFFPLTSDASETHWLKRRSCFVSDLWNLLVIFSFHF